MLKLTEAQQAKLEAMVEAGQFDSPEAALDAAIHALSQPEPLPLSDEQIAEARRRIADIEAGVGLRQYDSREEFRAAILAKTKFGKDLKAV